MTDCAASAVILDGSGGSSELGCGLWQDHMPPIHWDKTAGVHWFRIEEMSGYAPDAELTYEPASG